jgi:DNA-binding NtrC family response regulator
LRQRRSAMTKKTHILLVEDAEETRKTFGAILRKAGYDVTEAQDGGVALREIIALQKTPRKVDLLLTDLWMENLDGLQLLDQLDKMRMRVPTLVMTGNSDKEVVVELMRRGCLDYIEKPFGATELLQHLAAILKKLDQDQQNSQSQKQA